MKAFFGMTAAALLVVMMLFAALPGSGLAAEGKVTLAEMVKIKKAADEAVQTAKAQAEKAKTAEEKLLAKWLLKQAETNAEVAGDLLEEVKAGEDVSREEAQTCKKIAKAGNEAAAALAAGDMAKAEDALDRIARMSSNLPTAANARAVMQGADGAMKNQPVTADDSPNGNCKVGRTKHIRLPDSCNNNTPTVNYEVWHCFPRPWFRGGWFIRGKWYRMRNKQLQSGACKEPKPICVVHGGNAMCKNKNEHEPALACTCTGGGGAIGAAVKNAAASFVFDRNCVNGQVVEDSCRYPSPSVPHNCPCPAPAR